MHYTTLEVIIFHLTVTFRRHFLANFGHPWPCKSLISRKLGAGGNYPKIAITLCARLEELMSSLFREVSVHLTRSICETMNNLPAWEPVLFTEIQPENWSNANRCHKQRQKKEWQTLFHNIGRRSCWYMKILETINITSSNDLQKWDLAKNASGQIQLKLRPYHIMT